MTDNSNLMDDIAKPTDPRVLEAWRAAAKAYRENINLTYGAASDAAKFAVLQAMPELTVKEATDMAIAAVAYASKYHSKWLYALHVSKPKR
jgi:hypothetical protein